MIKGLLTTLLLPLSILSCSNLNESISLEGTWVSCFTVENVKSRKITITVNQSNIEERISEYSTNSICENTPSSEVVLVGTIFFEQLGESIFTYGGTNVTITFTNIDYYNCGLGDPAYTYWQIPNNLGFWQASSVPSCEPIDRGSGVTLYFNKIN